MTDFTVANGVTSSGQIYGPADTLTVQDGGSASGNILLGTLTAVQAGGVAEAEVVTDGAIETVDGRDLFSTVADGGVIAVQSDGAALNLRVLAGGELVVNGPATPNQNLGVAASTTISVAGLMEVQSGGLASATTLSGGLELVMGLASVDSGAVVLSGGVQQVVSSGLISATTVSFGGSAVAESTGLLRGATIKSGGVSIEQFGGLASGTIVSGGGVDLVSVSGSALSANLASGGEQIVSSGGLAFGTQVQSGGEQLVVSSSLAQATHISAGGSAVVETLAVLSGARVSSGGAIIERLFGTASGTTVLSGGKDTVSSTGIAVQASVAGVQLVSGGTTTATHVTSGGKQTIYAGGVASRSVVGSGGTETVRSGGIAAGATVSAGGTLVVEAGATVQGTLAGAGTLELAGGTAAISGALFGLGSLRVDAPASDALPGPATFARVVIDGGLTTAETLTVTGGLTLGGSATGARTLAGTGTLALTGGATSFSTGATLSIAKVNQSGAAAVTVAETALTYAGVWTQTGGTITVGPSRTLTFTGTGGSFSGTLTGGGKIDFAGGTDTLNDATLSAASMVVNGGVITLAGTITLPKTLTVASAGFIEIAFGGASLTGGGTLSLGAGTALNAFAGTLTNVDDKITGAGFMRSGEIVNEAAGSIIANGAKAPLGISSTISNAGLIASEGAGGLDVFGDVVNTGSLEVLAGVLIVRGPVTGAGGSVTIAAGAARFLSAFSQNVAFTGTSGTLELGDSHSYTGAISGFSLTGGTSLDLADIRFKTTAKATYVDNGSGTGGVLTVTNGTQTAHIDLVGDYIGSTFTVSAAADGHGGTTVVDPHSAKAPVAAAMPAAVLPFIAAMASYDPGGGHWVSATESGRSSPLLMTAVTSGR